MNRVIVSIGSNIQPELNIPEAVLSVSLKHRLLEVTHVEETQPLGIIDQPNFHNAAMKIETWFSQDGFKIYLKEVEDLLLRDRTTEKYGPRTIDLDIVVWNDEVVDEDYYSRDFLKKHTDQLMKW
ncbi:2-amino-4-hydroxy-6-hydroxymethyldihydropteridine diphosphokinase [Halosquirtibacter xylanolyticus]|uniref:2-amino-4-hydroxy-6- hydroxymethyldihydropteridine diphosphokinase n=1 Tax=Halosquirtibacter xylanolyticus TaxID=3374599 RepID=UPI0037491CD2|nr:2-amino-4-hydroxy-6-hydroxymethyldihydropteridine diphosphokinase [Prolixibacteraceae bacterium]